MDAQLLARSGMQVISSDISIGAALGARERAKRFGLAILPIVADVEHLPFADRSVDMVYVHDGLHHLEDPLAGVAEMARVASQAVSITEPARAAITGLAVRLGLALEREEAGNPVARVSPSELGEALDAGGFDVLRAERYGMYYTHTPGRLTSFASIPGVFQLMKAGWWVANAVFGRFGNKAVVVAKRPHAEVASGAAVYVAQLDIDPGAERKDTNWSHR